MPIADMLEAWGNKMIWGATVLVLGGLSYLIYPVGWTMQGDVNDLKSYVVSHEIAVRVIVAELEEEGTKQQQQLDKILEYLEKEYYITGTGSVGTFGGDEPYVRVNRRSGAAIYKDGDRIRITCNDVEGKPESVLRVNGTFSDSNQDLLISFSKQAADDLGLTSRVEVELEPVNEK